MIKFNLHYIIHNKLAFVKLFSATCHIICIIQSYQFWGNPYITDDRIF
jgi:hypothetical protein